MRAGVARTDSSPGDGASPSDHSNSTEKPIQKASLLLQHTEASRGQHTRVLGM